MEIFFIDESSTICPPNNLQSRYFVLAGPIIHECEWHQVTKKFADICRKWKINGEIKWRYFGQRHGRQDSRNNLGHLKLEERDRLRTELLSTLVENPFIKIHAVILNLPNIYDSGIQTPEEAYAYAYRYLIRLFQLHLEDLSHQRGTKINGIIVSDHRNATQDMAQRSLHMDILKSTEPIIYSNLIENIFFSPSHHSVGIQLADLVSGSIFRFYEHGDTKWYNIIRKNLWEPLADQSESIMLEKLGFLKIKDAESVGEFTTH